MSEKSIHELPRDILVHGVFSTRKTSVAMTASSFYPPLPEVAPLGILTKLSDVAVISWDPQGTIGLPHLGIELPPENIFNATGRLNPDGKGGFEAESITSVINASRAFALERVKAGCKFIIHDTLSVKDVRNVAFWTKTVEDAPGAGNDTAQKIYRNVLKTHSMDLEYFQNLAAYYNVMNIWLCHTSIAGKDPPSTDARAVAAATLQRAEKGLLGAELAAQITGASWKHYYNTMRMVFYQTVEVAYGKQQAMWLTRSNEVAVKPGLPENVLPSKMPADFRLLFKIARGEKI